MMRKPLKKCGSIYGNAGFSLVELLIASTLGITLTLGTISVFVANKETADDTDRLGRMLENGRFALNLMTEDLMHVNFLGDFSGDLYSVQTWGNITIANDCNGDGNAGTLSDGGLSNVRPIWGSLANADDVVGCLGGANPDTHILMLKRLLGQSLANNELEGNRTYLLANTNVAYLFSGANPSPPSNAPTGEVPNGRIWEFQNHVYYIQDQARVINGQSINIPSLKRMSLIGETMISEEIAEGIENFSVLYGVDNDDNGAPDQYLDLPNITRAMWEESGRIVAVKLFLLIRSLEPDGNYENNVSYTFGDKSMTPTGDHFYRMVLSSTVMLRNPQLRNRSA